MKKLIKGLLMFLCVFIILAVVITYIVIQNTVNNQDDLEHVLYNKDEENTDVPKESGIDLYGTYNQNDLLISDLVENYNGVDVSIPKIEGLKDTKVQDKINQDIYNRTHEVLKKYLKINHANYYVRANFANVISIGFYLGSDSKSEQLYLNYNLINGEKLKLEELFINDADITDIVRHAFYETEARNNQFENENSIVSPNEEKVYKSVKGFMATSDKKFAFSPSEIYFYYNEDMASVKMIDIYDKVSIYNKYLTDKSIYTNNDIGYKNIFTCANGNYDIFEKIEYGYLENNFWYDISIWKSYEEDVKEDKLNKFNAFKERIYSEVDMKINEYRKIAKNNPEKFYILLAKPSVSIHSDAKYKDGKWEYTYSDLANVNKNIQIFEMPLEVYEKIYKDKLIAAYRYQYFEMGGGAYLDTEANDGATITKLTEFELYNYITGEEITKVEDVFYEDSNYIEVIKDKTKERLIEKYNYSDNEISKLLETINYELDGTQVNVTIPLLEDFMVILYFNNFDNSMLKIF